MILALTRPQNIRANKLLYLGKIPGNKNKKLRDTSRPKNFVYERIEKNWNTWIEGLERVIQDISQSFQRKKSL